MSSKHCYQWLPAGLLSIYCVPATVLSPRDPAGNKLHKSACPGQADILLAKTQQRNAINNMLKYRICKTDIYREIDIYFHYYSDFII